MKRVSTVALGLMLVVHQTMSLQMARAAQLSLGAGSNSDMTELTAPVAETETAQLQSPSQECEKAKPSQSSELNGKPNAPQQGNTGLNYQASNTGNTGQLVAQQPTGIDPGTPAAASAEDDCCEVSGNALCEVAGVPPAGGGFLGASPLLALAALPLAAIPLIPSGRSGQGENSPPVPEPSSTAGLVAGFGVVGLLLSRRRQQRNDKSER